MGGKGNAYRTTLKGKHDIRDIGADINIILK
jgi:hypothetical protein